MRAGARRRGWCCGPRVWRRETPGCGTCSNTSMTTRDGRRLLSR